MMNFKKYYDRKHAALKQKEVRQAKAEAWLLEVVKEAEEIGWAVTHEGNRIHVKDKRCRVCCFDITAKTGVWSRHHVLALGYGHWQNEHILSPFLGHIKSMIHDYIADCSIVYNQRLQITKAEEEEL